MTEFILAGHSHAYALGLPGAARDATPAVVEIAPGFLGLTGGWPRDGAYWSALAEHSSGRIALVSWLGNEHLAHFFFQSDPPFDVFDPVDPDPTHDHLIPQERVREVFRSHRDDLPKALAEVVPQARAVAVLGTMPPKGDGQAVQALLDKEPFFQAKRQASPTPLEVTPLRLQLKLWRIMQSMLAEAAEQTGARFIPFPAEAIAQDGTLKRQFWKDDVSHANSACGALQVAAIRSQFSQDVR